jgi:uncharacterized membrane-anchored protein
MDRDLPPLAAPFNQSSERYVMLKKMFAVATTVFLLGNVPSLQAADDGQAQMTADQFVASLKFQSGKIDLPNGIATLDLPPSFRYLNPEDSGRVLVDAWGNPPGGTTLGMIFPADASPLSQSGWGIVITYDEDGHVGDEEADTIDYDEMLKDMQSSMEEANVERKKEGYEPVSLVGWAEAPSYDKANHKLYWAKELAFGDAQQHTLNYNIRVLGRQGVLVLNAVAGMDQISTIKAEMPNVLSATNFKTGNNYADFNSSTDKVATYGIAALVAGGVAAKMGLFAKLFALLIAFKKVILFGLIALGVGIKKFLGMRKKEEKPQAAD